MLRMSGIASFLASIFGVNEPGFSQDLFLCLLALVFFACFRLVFYLIRLRNRTGRGYYGTIRGSFALIAAFSWPGA